jgi:hypothetical protein
MDPIGGGAVFSPEEREQLQANPFLRPYANITKMHLHGLLSALGEYALRAGPPAFVAVLRPESVDPATFRAHRDLLGFYWERTGRDGPGSAESPVFDPEERLRISRDKYTNGFENISKARVISLLDALGRFAVTAPRIEQPHGPLQGVVRLIHAHNALAAFADRPFTEDEFSKSVRAVVRGEASQLTSPGTKPGQ